MHVCQKKMVRAVGDRMYAHALASIGMRGQKQQLLHHWALPSSVSLLRATAGNAQNRVRSWRSDRRLANSRPHRQFKVRSHVGCRFLISKCTKPRSHHLLLAQHLRPNGEALLCHAGRGKKRYVSINHHHLWEIPGSIPQHPVPHFVSPQFLSTLYKKKNL